MKPLRIALYYPWIYLKGGVERSIAALLAGSSHEWTIFVNHYEPENTFPEFAGFKVVQVGDVSVDRDMGSVLRAAVKLLTLRLPLEGFDALLVVCDGLGPLTTFRNSSLPTYCLCCTPLRPVYDRVYALEAMQARKGLARVAFKAFQSAFRIVDRLAWRRFDGVIAICLEVKERIVNYNLYPDDGRLVLHYPGIDSAASTGPVSYEPFLLVPGRISWTKNVQLAINAFKLADLPAPWRLVVAGFVDRKSQAYLAQIKATLPPGMRVDFVVNPSDEALNELYRRTSAVLFTPLNEDWGIVPLEGMMYGKPVIANNQGGPRESVIPGVTGWLTPPNDVGAWADIIRQFPAMPERIRSMGADGRSHVRRYDWSHFCAGVDDVLARGVASAGNSRRSNFALANN
jgi:glycosyltransferase involved in cell wall biosynthesis